MEFRVNEKTGFVTSDRFVRIFDERGMLFYFRNPSKLPFRFNLPKGTYSSGNSLKRTQPRKYKLPMLPKYERTTKPHKQVQLLFGNNPHKASIFIDKGIILFDYAIRDLSIPQQRQIFYHELAHYHYKTEAYCDLFAVRRMLIEGFNPSQCYYSVKGTLNDSKESHYRKDYILKKCERV